MDKIVNLSKRRGFVFQSAEIYGGFRSTYDYGPIGSLMLRNVKDAWIRSMVQQRDDVVSEELLAIDDGPMFEHGLKAMAGRAIRLPDRSIDRPDRDLLARRFEQFVP